MATTKVSWVVVNKLGYKTQSVRNVQPKAQAVLKPDQYAYTMPEIGEGSKALNELKADIDAAFDSLFTKLDSLTVTGQDGESQSFADYIDSKNFEGFLQTAYGKVSAKASALVHEGSIFSDTVKEHLIATTVDENGETVLTDADFTTPTKGGKTSTSTSAPVVEIEIEDSDF